MNGPGTPHACQPSSVRAHAACVHGQLIDTPNKLARTCECIHDLEVGLPYS
jgi:hypothetical protein